MSGAARHPGEGHRQRLREKFLRHGLGKFTDEEVLELLLTLATPRRDCKAQARGLMKRFGSLQAVMDAPVEELAKIKGVGPRNILGIKLVPAVARRYLEDQLVHRGPLADPRQAADYFRMTMSGLKQEVFRVILLDTHNRVLGVEEMFSGTLNRAVVYPREVVARALGVGAAGIICAHNHPSGEPSPSTQDEEFTRLLVFACMPVGVRVLDHLIVAGAEIYSFAEHGRIAVWEAEYQALGLGEAGV